MKKYILFLFALLAFGQLQAQQDAQYTQFMFNKLALNPAYAGSSEVPCLSIIHRSQWVGLEGAPTSQALSYHQTLRGNRVGLGVNILHDKIGPTDSWRANLAYAYRLQLKEAKLSLGLQGSIFRYQVDWADSNLTHSNDNLVEASEQSNILANVGAGLYYERERLYVGLSIPHIIRTDISLLNDNYVSTDVNSFEENHIYLMAGGILPLTDMLQLKPAGLLKYVPNTPLDFDLNLSLLIKQKVSLGLSYRLGGSTMQGFGESIDVVATFIVNKSFRIGGAFDFTLSELNNYNVGSFEVMAQYCWHKTENVSNPRFF